MSENTKNVNEVFNHTKNKVLDLISKSNTEITSQSKEKKSGIYMIYIDSFSDSKILPIYIGKAVDIQHRYKEHYKEILSLNRLSYETFSLYNEKGIYDGAFKSCKIFKYMIEHNCSLKDYHLIVLEYCDKDILEEREQFYIQLLKSEYFGFNQLNSKTLWIPFSIASTRTKDKDIALKYIKAVQENCKNIEKYFDYGFTEFNYNYAFHYSPVHCYIEDDDLLKELEFTNQMILDLGTKINSKYINQKIANDYDIKTMLSELHNLQENGNSLQKYEELKDIKKQRKQILKELRLNFLAIQMKYNDLPLKDNEIKLSLNSEIYFAISNDGKNNRPAEIVKVSYNLNGDNNEFYIENDTTIKTATNIKYVEKLVKFSHLAGFQKEVYKIIPANCGEDYRGLIYPKHISISSEFKTGINDFTIKNNKLYPLNKVVEEIVKSMPANKKVKIICSESKKLIKDLLEESLSKNLYKKFIDLVNI